MLPLNAIFEDCRPHLYFIALKICGNTQNAEDAVQDALLLGYTRLHQLKDPAAFLPWMRRIVTNCAYELLRKTRPVSTPDSDRMIEDSVSRRYEEMGNRNALYTALSLLPEALRTTMMLRYLSDTPAYSQIAEIMGVPVGTVRSRLNEGKKQLARHWNQLQHSDDAEYGRTHYWNKLYTELMPSVYDDNANIKSLMSTMDRALKLIFTSGKTVQGRAIFEKSIYDDLEHGSRIDNVLSCMTSGNISVINVTFKNSSEHPDHCPPGSYLILQRDATERVSSMRLFHSARNKKVVSEFS